MTSSLKRKVYFMNSFSENNDECIACEFQDNLAVLREISFFARLPMETLKILAYLFTREVFKKGDYLFHQHEDAGYAIYMISGTAELVRSDADQEKHIREYGENSFLGGMNLLGDVQHLYSLRATSNLTCLVLTREKFTTAMEQFPELKPKVIQALIERIRGWEEGFLADQADKCEGCRKKLGVSLI